VEGDGSARIYATAPGAGAIVVRGGFAQKQIEDAAMNLERVDTVVAGADSVLHLPEGRVERPLAQRHYAVRDGVLVALDTPTLVIHGGAGVEPGDLTADEEVVVKRALEAALRAGHAKLQAGASPVDAITAAITVLEDAPQFNAGRGAVFTHDGRNELDTSIMDGASGKAGAAAGLHRVKNPITLARAIMDKSRHVMMVGDGAEMFAKEQGIALVDPAYFRTEKRWQGLQRALQEEKKAQAGNQPLVLPGKAYFGTVGALALDARALGLVFLRAFLLVFLLFSFTLGVAVLMGETLLGSLTRRGVVGAFGELMGKRWRWVGAMGLLCSLLIFSFYSVVGGWTVGYAALAVAGKLNLSEGSALTALFNGYVSQYLHKPIRVEPNQRIRAWVLDAGPSENSAFHIVGTIFDTVFKEGTLLLSPDARLGGSQALDLQPSQGGYVEFTFDEGEMLTEHTSPRAVVVQLLEGRMSFTVGDDEVTLAPADVVYLAPNERHALVALEPCRMSLVMVDVAVQLP